MKTETLGEPMSSSIFYKIMDDLHYGEIFSLPPYIEDTGLMITIATGSETIFFDRTSYDDYRFIIRFGHQGVYYDLGKKIIKLIKE